MAFQPCTGIASLTVSATLESMDVAQNILHFEKNDGTAWGTGDLTNLVNSFDTWMGTAEGKDATQSFMSSTATIENLLARDLSVDGGAEFGKTVSHAGLDGSTRLPAGLTFAITLRTGLVGRSFRGRLFMINPCVGFNDTTPDSVKAASADAVKAGYTDLITRAAGWSPAMKWVVLSRFHKVGDIPNVKRAVGIGTEIKSVGYSQLYLDYQRRRAPFHARHH